MSTRLYDVLFKLVLIGDSSVGKSSLLQRFVDNVFSAVFVTNIGIDFKVKTMEVNGKQVKLQIWDTAGQERFKSITRSYYRGADGIMLVFDVGAMDSYEHVSKWLQGVRELARSDVEMVLVGNKSDLMPRAVLRADVEKFAQLNGVPYIETSARANTGINEAFLCLVNGLLLKHRHKEAERLALSLKQEQKRPMQWRC